MKSFITTCIAACLGFVLTGCNVLKPANEDIKKLAEQDPDFKQALDKKEKIDSEIASALNEFYAYKNEVDSKIDSLKKEYKARKAEVNLRLKDLKSRLNPEREDIRNRLIILTNELKVKSKDLSSLKQRRAALEEMLSDKDKAVDDETKQKWDDELKTIELKEIPLKDEVKSLEHSLRLLKVKLSLLKQ